MAAAPEGIVREDGKIRYAGETYISGVIRTMHCEVTELAYNLHYSQHSVRDAPEFRPYFRGQAVIAHDCICVVGTDHARASVLEPIRKGIESPESDVIRCSCGRFAGADGWRGRQSIGVRRIGADCATRLT